jgi:hypothetical protein
VKRARIRCAAREERSSVCERREYHRRLAPGSASTPSSRAVRFDLSRELVVIFSLQVEHVGSTGPPHARTPRRCPSSRRRCRVERDAVLDTREGASRARPPARKPITPLPCG